MNESRYSIAIVPDVGGRCFGVCADATCSLSRRRPYQIVSVASQHMAAMVDAEIQTMVSGGAVVESQSMFCEASIPSTARLPGTNHQLNHHVPNATGRSHRVPGSAERTRHAHTEER